MSAGLCVDCVAEATERGDASPRSRRPTPYSGPRCVTHQRARVKLAKKAKRAGAVRRTRGITAEQSHELLLFQDGVCWLCRRATGSSKALAHDHDHKHCAGPDSCPECLRGRLCSTCNRMLGHLRDDPEAFDRAAAYLRGDTPWARLNAGKELGQRVVRIQVQPNGTRFAYVAGGYIQNLRPTIMPKEPTDAG